MEFGPETWDWTAITGVSVSAAIVLTGIWLFLLGTATGTLRRPRPSAAYRAFAQAHARGTLVCGQVSRVDDGRACVVLQRYVVGFMPAGDARPGDLLAGRVMAVDVRTRRVELMP